MRGGAGAATASPGARAGEGPGGGDGGRAGGPGFKLAQIPGWLLGSKGCEPPLRGAGAPPPEGGW